MITIRYEVAVGRGERSAIKEKTFKTQEAMEKWCEKQESTNDRFIGVVAYSYDR